jgi:hypothetical protein
MSNRASRRSCRRAVSVLRWFFVFTTILLSVGIDSADALGPIDQQQTEPGFGEVGLQCFGPGGAVIQEVTPGADAWEVVSVFLMSSHAQSVTMEIRSEAPDGPVIGTASGEIHGADWVHFTFEPAVSLTPGTAVFIRIGVEDRVAWSFNRSDPYAGGSAYSACSSELVPLPKDDFHFVTYRPEAQSPDTDGDGTPDESDPDDDEDGISDEDEIAAGSDPLNPASTPEVCDGVDNDGNDGVDENGICGAPDTDGDGIPDDQDVEGIEEAVAAQPDSSFKSRGHRNSIRNALEDAEASIAAGDIAGAIRKLQNLRRKVDGCGALVGLEIADNDDWITDCAAQHEIRELIDQLIDNLSA